MIEYAEDLPGRRNRDYLGLLAGKASTFGAITTVELGNSKKQGGASATISLTSDSVNVEHAGRCLILKTKTPAEVAEKVKKWWRKERGPAIKIKA